MRKISGIGTVFALIITMVTGGGASARNGGGPSAEVSSAVHHDVSRPLRELAPTSPTARRLTEHPLRLIGPSSGTNQPDGALQTASTGTAVATTSGSSFAGVGNGDYGFAPNAAPPDTSGAAGATQYVQWVNESFAVFSKSGLFFMARLLGTRYSVASAVAASSTTTATQSPSTTRLRTAGS